MIIEAIYERIMMDRFSIWYGETIDFDDLPTVRDFLMVARPALVADALAPRYESLAEWDGETPPTATEVWERAERILQGLLNAPVTSPDAEKVMMPKTVLKCEDLARPQDMTIATESALVMRDDLPRYKRYLDGERPETFDAMPPWNGYAYELDSWPTILSYRVFVPSRFCERELYQFVADVVWEATFFGEEADVADERRGEKADDLAAAIAEVEQARAEGRLDEVVTPYDPAAELAALVGERPTSEKEYERRLGAVYGSFRRVLSAEFHRDCVDLARRLGMLAE